MVSCVRRRDLLARIDLHLERGNELMERNREAFERNREAFERNREAFERNREAFERNTAVVEQTQAVLRESAAAMHGVRDSLRGMGNVIGRQVEVLRDLQVEVRQQTEGLMRILDRLDRLDGSGPGEQPAPG
jgi:predicted  nucleic acid-binding Zn-ribbon protein